MGRLLCSLVSELTSVVIVRVRSSDKGLRNGFSSAALVKFFYLRPGAGRWFCGHTGDAEQGVVLVVGSYRDSVGYVGTGYEERGAATFLRSIRLVARGDLVNNP